MNRFFVEFRNDHRQLRDLIMNCVAAFSKKDIIQATILIEELGTVAGPHFQFEEAALYPKLIPIYGSDYINKLYTDHDLTIARVRNLKELINNEQPDDDTYEKGIHLLKGLLPHLSDCEGLTIMIEMFENKQLLQITKSMKEARAKNMDLLTWADSARNRKNLKLIY